MKLTIGLYGLFLLLVAINGNSSTLADDLTTDMGPFLPWLVVAAILGFLYNRETTHEISLAFIVLIILSFAIVNKNNIVAQGKAIYQNAVKPAAP